MAEIINFPTREIRDWVEIERDLVQYLRKAKLHPDAEREILSRMKSFIELLNIQIAFPYQDNAPEVFSREMSRCITEINELSARLVKERLECELERVVLKGIA